MAYKHSDPCKLKMLNDTIASTGTIGYLAILDNLRLDNADFRADAASDTLTFTIENKLVTGSRIRLTSTTTLPGGLLSNTDYYAIGVSTTTIKLASTLANAIDGTAINITDAGSGTLKAFEQELTEQDGIAAVLAHELINPAYTQRLVIQNLGPATIVNGDAQKNPWSQIFTNNTSNSITSAYRVVLRGGTSAIGSAGVAEFSLDQELMTIYSGESKSFVITFTR